MTGHEYVAGRKDYIFTLTMCTVFQLIINLCKNMRDRKHGIITQTIHKVCSVTQAIELRFNVSNRMYMILFRTKF